VKSRCYPLEPLEQDSYKSSIECTGETY
jgi:hypothetical protein